MPLSLPYPSLPYLTLPYLCFAFHFLHISFPYLHAFIRVLSLPHNSFFLLTSNFLHKLFCLSLLILPFFSMSPRYIFAQHVTVTSGLRKVRTIFARSQYAKKRSREGTKNAIWYLLTFFCHFEILNTYFFITTVQYVQRVYFSIFIVWSLNTNVKKLFGHVIHCWRKYD